MKLITFLAKSIMVVLLFGAMAKAADDTVIVSAEGLVDPNAEMYRHDKGLMIDDLRNDAKKQAIEKVVGIFVDSNTLVENYMLVHDKVLTQSQGIIKKVVKESKPWLGKDGFMHLLIKAEVYTGNTRDILETLSQKNRALKMREAGSPTISVAISVIDAHGGKESTTGRSDIAENVFKKKMAGYGYRVVSEEAVEKAGQRLEKRHAAQGKQGVAAFYATMGATDFAVRGTAKVQPVTVKMKSSGVKLKKYTLTSWTIKCFDTRTGEELYFNNTLPERKSWVSEDKALSEIGRMVSEEFSSDFFAQIILATTQKYQLLVEGLPSYDVATLLKKELIGLRSILNVDLRSFDLATAAHYEVEFTGSREHFTNSVNQAVVRPLNAKLGEQSFQVAGIDGKFLRLIHSGKHDAAAVVSKFEQTPPSSLVTASRSRVEGVAKTRETAEKVEKSSERYKDLQANQTSTSRGDGVKSEISSF